MFGLLGDVLTPLPLPLDSIPVTVKQDKIVAGTGGRLKVEGNLGNYSSRDLRMMRSLLSVSDRETHPIAELQEDLLRKRNLSYSIEIPPAASPGKGRISFLLYPSGDIPTLDEHIVGSARFQIQKEPEPTGYPEDASPDLVISTASIRISPQSPLSGETVFFDVDIANRGKAPAFDISAEAYEASSEMQGAALNDALNWEQPSIPWIRPGETRALRLRWDPYQNAGKQEVIVLVDPSERIIESDETNNSATVAIYVRKKMDLALLSEDFSAVPSAEIGRAHV